MTKFTHMRNLRPHHTLWVCLWLGLTSPAIGQDLETYRENRIEPLVAYMRGKGFSDAAIIFTATAAETYCKIVVDQRYNRDQFAIAMFEIGTQEENLPPDITRALVGVAMSYASSRVCP